MIIKIPRFSLVMLIGISGSGKSTFAKRHFSETEVLSSDYCRALVSDDENDQGATKDAFAVLSLIARKRLVRGKLTVVDATSIKEEDREPLIALARRYHYIPVAIVFNLPLEICLERSRNRTGRRLPDHVIQRQHTYMEHSIRNLENEGVRFIYILNSEKGVNSAQVVRLPIWR